MTGRYRHGHTAFPCTKVRGAAAVGASQPDLHALSGPMLIRERSSAADVSSPVDIILDLVELRVEATAWKGKD